MGLRASSVATASCTSFLILLLVSTRVKNISRLTYCISLCSSPSIEFSISKTTSPRILLRTWRIKTMHCNFQLAKAIHRIIRQRKEATVPRLESTHIILICFFVCMVEALRVCVVGGRFPASYIALYGNARLSIFIRLLR